MELINQKMSILEGLLFLVGDEGITLKQIALFLEITAKEAEIVISELEKSYNQETRGIKLSILGERYKLTTKPEHFTYYQKLTEQTESNLSNAALEILAIIAYNQPVTRVQIEEIRGVNSETTIKRLIAKALIREVGRDENKPGSPYLYAVTDEFMDAFNLSSLKELPELQVIDELNEESDIFTAKYMEE